MFFHIDFAAVTPKFPSLNQLNFITLKKMLISFLLNGHFERR